MNVYFNTCNSIDIFNAEMVRMEYDMQSGTSLLCRIWKQASRRKNNKKVPREGNQKNNGSQGILK